MIDWAKPSDSISKYFAVHDAIYLPSFQRLATEADGLTDLVKASLLVLFAKMDVVREILDKPIRSHCGFRPRGYNILVGGSKGSAHLSEGPWAAYDWDAEGQLCSETRSILLPHIEGLGLRMEDTTGPWVHTDTRPVPPGGARFFKP